MPLTPVLTTRWGAEQSWRLSTYERLDGYAALRTALSMTPGGSRPTPDTPAGTEPGTSGQGPGKA